MALPKVLILGQTFNKLSGGGITQSNLFSRWDKDKLAVACTPHLLVNSDRQICDTYYQLGQKEHKWNFPFNYLQKKFYSGLLKNNSDTQVFTSTAKPSFRSKIVDNLFFPLIRYLGLIHSISRIELSKDFCKWLDEFSPDIIYAQGQDRERILFSLSVYNYLKKPLIFHMMDDWPSTISDRGLFKNHWNKKIDREFQILMTKASLLLSISDAMANEYKKRYNKNFITFHNPVNIDFWQEHQKKDYSLANPPTMLYAGRIGLGIETSLEMVAKAITLLNKEINISLKFRLQTADKLFWFDNYSCVEHQNLVSYDRLPQIFSEVDFLILPYDFSEKSIKYIQYSMPTKAPEYMMSGTPILVFAPEKTAIVEYAKNYKWAKIVVSNNVKELAFALKDLILDKNLRVTIGQNAKKIAEEKHNSIIVSNTFKALISSLATNINSVPNA